MIVFKRIFVLFSTVLLLAACASTESKKTTFDSELYDGESVDTLTGEEPPLTEIEAIQRGDSALEIKNYDLALYEYIRSLSFTDAKFQDRSLHTIGEIHQRRGNFALAEKSFLKALEFNPDSVNTLENVGIIYSKKGLISEGRSYLFRAINVDQVRLDNKYIIDRYELISEPDVAALNIDGESPEKSYMGLGVLADIDAQHDIAKRFYEKALEINPRSTQTMINLGYSHYMSGNYHIAKRLMNSALQFEPNNERALNNLALTHLALNETTKALNVFMRQMDAAEALNNIGYFLILHGKPEQAVAYLEQAIDKKSSYYPVANENLNRALADIRAKSTAQ